MIIYQVYRITNTVNGMSYIGQTSKTLNRRWRAHVEESNHPKVTSTYFHRAIRKYGADSFTKEVLFTCRSKATADLYERGHIKFFHTRDKGKGYNLTDGGEGVSGFKHSEESKQKMSAAKIGKKVPNRKLGVKNHCTPHKAETRLLISAGLKGNTNGRGLKGKPWTEARRLASIRKGH